MKIKLHKIWWYLLGATVSIASVYLMYRLITPNLDMLIEIRSNLRMVPLILTFPVYSLGVMSSAVIWGKIMISLGINMPLSRHILINIITNVAKRIPGMIWHVLGRIAWYEHYGIRKSITTFANILEPVLIILSGLIMTTIFLPFLSTRFSQSPLFFVGGIIVGFFMIHPRLIQAILSKSWPGNPAGKLTYRSTVGWILSYMLIWLIGGTVLFLVIKAMIEVPLSLWPVCIAAWCAAGVAGTLAIFLPAGFGLSEATISLILASQIPPSIAVGAAILLRILLTLYEFILALVLFLFRKHLVQPVTIELEQIP